MRKKANVSKYTFDDIIFKSSAMSECISIAKKIANSNYPVLITGETGTGKELLAHAIHNSSHRNEAAFIAVNCAAFSSSLLESELFGYEKGSFTGALKEGKKGIFERADGGTVFLDEIGDAPEGIQTALLRVIQEKELRRVGGTVDIPVNVRIISATNIGLKEAVKRGDFRKDLYYRLNVFHIEVPPLRKRKEDIREIIFHIMARRGYAYKQLSEEVLRVMEELPWEGNVRELENCVTYFCMMSEDRIELQDLPKEYFYENSAVSKPSSEGTNIFDFNEKILFGEYASKLFVLSKIAAHSIGRKKLVEVSKEYGLDLTENDVKNILHQLREEGYIVQSKGRKGATITKKGLQWLRIKMDNMDKKE